MDIKLVDVMVHIDESIDHDLRESLADKLRALDGVVAAASHDEKPHLMVVEYDPDRIKSTEILAAVTGTGVHAELVGM